LNHILEYSRVCQIKRSASAIKEIGHFFRYIIPLLNAQGISVTRYQPLLFEFFFLNSSRENETEDDATGGESNNTMDSDTTTPF
jgi:hypothetical protein